MITEGGRGTLIIPIQSRHFCDIGQLDTKGGDDVLLFHPHVCAVVFKRLKIYAIKSAATSKEFDPEKCDVFHRVIPSRWQYKKAFRFDGPARSICQRSSALYIVTPPLTHSTFWFIILTGIPIVMGGRYGILFRLIAWRPIHLWCDKSAPANRLKSPECRSSEKEPLFLFSLATTTTTRRIKC